MGRVGGVGGVGRVGGVGSVGRVGGKISLASLHRSADAHGEALNPFTLTPNLYR
ncbi:hypothetical protein [Aulosira sp. FACHB-615]|uniref:hypothetical protein n=1 Tax=Aulosira sp. FACHB-615 TaxID=2692777 RepID=UPI001686B8AF|nr:hypothetical protein [Aulosira sp. FACHB-615]MBD2487765.1 hypothetical protein [Aulosira sp. FACHB-615]